MGVKIFFLKNELANLANLASANLKHRINGALFVSAALLQVRTTTNPESRVYSVVYSSQHSIKDDACFSTRETVLHSRTLSIPLRRWRLNKHLRSIRGALWLP